MLFQRLLVSVDHWPADSLSPLGHYVRVLGKDGDKDVETQVRDSLAEELIELLAQWLIYWMAKFYLIALFIDFVTAIYS